MMQTCLIKGNAIHNKHEIVSYAPKDSKLFFLQNNNNGL